MEVPGTESTDQGASDLAGALHIMFNFCDRTAMLCGSDGYRSGSDHHSDRRAGVRTVHRLEIEAGLHTQRDRFVHAYDSKTFARCTGR